MIIDSLKPRLDALEQSFLSGRPAGTVENFTRFLSGLEELRSMLDHESWVLRAKAIREHSVFDYLIRCPMTRHSFDKPRGYPGDAALLDWIYFPDEKESGIDDPVGRQLYHHNVRRTAPAAVRARVKRIAKIIDEVPAGGSMLALACGHFHESIFSRSIRDGRLDRIDVVDQDEDSLRRVRDLGLLNLTAKTANVMRFPSATKDSARYDLVYAAGLFDYFSDRMAARVAKRLWTHVAPGGVLCIPNYNKNIPDAAYLECFMDWWLIYRDREEMQAIGEALPDESVAEITCPLLDAENIWYLQARKLPAGVVKKRLRLDSGSSELSLPHSVQQKSRPIAKRYPNV